MKPERERIYADLERKVGRTPLYEFELPNGSKIFAKAEYKNPTGSHYDRVYVPLLRALEEEGKIQPAENPLIETTSGNAGASFAWVCKRLGYECTVIVPPELPKARVDDIRNHGGHIRFSERGKYVRGAAEELRKVLKIENKERKAKGLPPFYTPNHSQDIRSTGFLERITEEVLDELRDASLDYAVLAVGNGATILGPGRLLKEKSPKTKIVAWEPFASGKAFDIRHPGAYESMFRIKPGKLKHTMYGTGVANVHFPMLEEALRARSGNKTVDEVRLVSEPTTFRDYYKKIGIFGKIFGAEVEEACVMTNPFRALSRKSEHILQQKNEFESQFVDWQDTQRDLHSRGFNVGKSSAGSFAVAEEIAKNENQPKNFFVIFYDPHWKYAEGNLVQKIMARLVA
ncbi:PLP-dependent lyase/thiolase [Candidatus Pacearchaeota archaeon]|nr:PLP-dependent lyase/thiolase [Candidatus Pacearchaeota archaeon]